MYDKKHWYDGKIYDKLIAPNQDRMFSQIQNLIPKGSKVLDIGCGTGRFALKLSDHFNEVVGIDLSSRNVNVANTNLRFSNRRNVSFFHGDLDKFKRTNNTQFDFAIFTYVIHEVDEKERCELLLNAKTIANEIIIGDYITPTPKSLLGMLNIVVEYFAGKEHYKNFNSYVSNGGLEYLANETKLEIIKEVKNNPRTSQLIVLK